MTDSALLIVKGAVADIALALLLFFRELPGTRARRLRDAIFALLGVVSLLGFNGFRHYLESGAIHETDFFHHYIGAKYLPELGYTRLYACSVLAIRELEGPAARAHEPAQIRRLADNALVDTDLEVGSSDCAKRFTPARWSRFGADVLWFRQRINDDTWRILLQDHGFNGSPPWAALARALIPPGPIQESVAARLAFLDVLLVLLACMILVFSFRSTLASSLAALMFGCASTWDGGWIAGSFLRLDWLVALLIGVACLHARRPLTAGAALGWAALSRIFPLFAIAGVLVAAFLQRGEAPWPRGFTLRFGAGLGLAATIGFGAPLVLFGSEARPAFTRFREDLTKHFDTNLTNNLGLRQLAFARLHPEEREPLSLPEKDLAWRSEQEGGLARRGWLYFPLLFGGIFLAIRALRREPPWVAAIVGIALAPWFHDLTCYYLLFQLLFGYLWLRRPAIGPALLGAAALDAIASLLMPVGWGERWAIAESAIYVALSAFAMWQLGSRQTRPASIAARQPPIGLLAAK